MVPRGDRATLKAQQLVADQDQSTEGSYKHAMRAPDQTLRQAQQLANKYVRGEITAARADEKAGKHNSALKHLGNAMHTLQDNTSPAHKGFQVWNGPAHVLDDKAHAEKENYDPGRGSNLDIATAKAWDYFTGKEQMPADFFPPEQGKQKTK
jgi:hypothetical protein